MKILVAFFVLLLLFFPSFSQSDSVSKSLHNYTFSIDTLRVQTIVPLTKKPWYENSALPWIVSLTIAILTVVVNIMISRSTRRTSLKVAESQFQATLNSNNRQDWINKVRDSISELMTQCKSLNIELQEKIVNENNLRTFHDKVTYQSFLLKLLLSADQPLHKELLAAVSDIMKTLDLHSGLPLEFRANFNKNPEFFQQAENVIEKGRALLYAEWQKIQNHQYTL